MNQKIDAVLIDDEEIQRLIWSLTAKRKGKKILVFASVNEFYCMEKQLDREIPIYIDSQLQNGVKGEEEARKISIQLGFKSIILTTGMDPDLFRTVSCIKNIQGKEPPSDW